jgi:hypothetical protein
MYEDRKRKKGSKMNVDENGTCNGIVTFFRSIPRRHVFHETEVSQLGLNVK